MINARYLLGQFGGAAAVAGQARASASSDALPVTATAQLALASLSGAAGVIHLVMVPSHMEVSTLEGTGFAVAGWLQLALALLIVARPVRPLLLAAIVANVALIAAWAFSRTAGLPFGPHAWHAESVSFVDATCVTLEAALIAIAGVLLLRPQLGMAIDRAGPLFASAVPIAALIVTTAALASPSARDHAAGSHGHHTVDDKGLSLLTNGHHAEIIQYELDGPTQAALDGQLAVTRQVAAQYSTVAAAEAAGYHRAGPYAPGLGVHYIKIGASELNTDGVLDDADLRHPLSLIYDGTEPGSEIAGFMYYSMSQTAPEGFAGPNDVWHYHERICLKYSANGQIDAPFGADMDATDAQCAAAGGSILPVTQWMVHVWSVPGYDGVDNGVFAEVNPGLKCADGTYYRLPPDEWAAHPLNVCRSEGS